MKIAAAYLRVSDERQDEYSPDSQLKLIREYAKKNDFLVPDEYVYYDDGISAKSAEKRVKFNEMIAVAKEKNPPFSAIIVWKYSRFARNQEESILYKNLLKKNNVQVISVSEPVMDSVFGSLIERIIEWMDEFYLINLSSEVKRGMLEKASRGEAMCHPAYGYDLIDGDYVPNEKEAPFVKLIFDKYNSGVPIQQIAKFCNSHGCRTHRGNEFDNRLVWYILNNPVYVGKIRWSKEGRAASKRHLDDENIVIVDGKHKPIVSEETFNNAQERLKNNKKIYGKNKRSQKQAQFMLKGLVRCECGATLTMISTACPSMQCYNYTHANGKCTVSHSLSISKANKLVIQALEESVKLQDFTILPRKLDSSPEIDYDKLIQAEKDKIMRCRELYINGVDTIEDFKQNKAKLEAVIEQLKEEQRVKLSKIPSKEVFAKNVKDVVEAIKSPDLTEDEKNLQLRTIIDHITFNKKENRLDFYFYA